MPALRLLLFASLGFVYSEFIGIDHVIVLLGLLFYSLILIFFKKFATIAFVLQFSIGILFHGLNYSDSYIHSDLDFTPAFVSGKITKILKHDSTTANFILHGSVDTKKYPLQNNVKLITSIKNPKVHLQVGDYFSSIANVSTPTEPLFTGDFNSYNYARNYGAKYLSKVNRQDYSIIPSNIIYYNLLSNLRYNFDQRLKLLFSNEYYPYAKALVSGDRHAIPIDNRNDFVATGTAHLLAISGLHIGIFVYFTLVLLQRIRNRHLVLIIASLAVFSFVLLSGMQPSSIRASLFAILFYFGKTYALHIDKYNLFAVVIILSLLFDPSLVYSVGFQLSVSSVLGIFIFFQPLNSKLLNLVHFNNYIVKFIIASISVSISATIISSFLSAYYFNVFSIISPISNLISVPIFSLAVVYTFLSLLSSYISLELALLFTDIAQYLFSFTLKSNQFFADFSFSFANNYVYLLCTLQVIAVYMLISTTKLKQFAFRFSLAISCLVLIYMLESKPNSYIQHWQNQDSQVSIFHFDNSTHVIVLNSDFYRKFDFYKFQKYLTTLDNKPINVYFNHIYQTERFDEMASSGNVKFYFQVPKQVLSKFITQNNLQSLNINKARENYVTIYPL